MCIGNSGPLHPEIEKVITQNNLNVATVLSGNRNFGRLGDLAAPETDQVGLELEEERLPRRIRLPRKNRA